MDTYLKSANKKFINPFFYNVPIYQSSNALEPHRAVGNDKVVHKQFNSPIGMYSDQNIIDTINAQVGLPSNPSPTLPRSNPTLRQVSPQQINECLQK